MPMPVTSSTLPLLDLTDFDRGTAERAAFLAQVREAAREVGFFYLKGHGISEVLVADVLSLSRRFFELPDADKLAIEMVNSPHFRGYTRPGWERTKGKPDWREQLDVGLEEQAAPRDPSLPPWTRLRGPNQWPAALPQLRPTLLRWQREVTAVAIRLLRIFAIALEQPADVFEPIYATEPNSLIKIIRYPGREATDGDQGVGAHKDSGFLTLLLQDRQRGLQVEGANGWIDAEPIPGTFIVNVGEVLEMASDGYLRATVHRVVTPPAGKDRLSVAFFLGAQLDATVPLLDLPPHLKAEAGGAERDPDNPLFREVGKNYLKGRLRSHPDVAKRFYSDLVDGAKADSNEPASAY
jgi:isopenicillin N synthase-like dioxygenase